MQTKVFYSENDLDRMGILSRPTRWRLRRENKFPASVSLSPGRVAYRAEDIIDWVNSLNTQRRGDHRNVGKQRK